MADRKKLLDLITERVLATRAEIGQAWPSIAHPRTGRWHTTEKAEWCAGYWVELLRIAGERTGDWGLYEEAAARTMRLRPWVGRADMFRSPLFFYSAARLYETLSDRASRTLALAAAYAGRAAAIPSNGGTPVGFPLGNGLDGTTVVAVDSVLGALQLDWWALRETGDGTFLDGAERQLALTERDFIRKDGSTVEFVAYDPESGKPERAFTVHGRDDGSCWSRGQAWAIAGFLRAWEETRDAAWIAAAQRLLAYWWEHADTDGIPAYDFADAAQADAPRDTSAAAIVAEALARISVLDEVPAEAGALCERLDGLIDGLAARVTPISAGDQRPAGMLTEGCANKPKAAAVAHELVWGDCHLYAALHCLEAGGLPC